MRKNVWMSLALVAVAVIALLVATGSSSDEPAGEVSLSERLVRPDSQRLSVAPDDKVTFVEFLDFECEACGAAYPAIEELRDMYEGQMTFVVRNFPLHFNSERAAQAAEAAGAQGKFEEMYDLLFTTQSQWAEKQISQEDLFFGFAEQLGVDMEQFRTVYEDPATIEKIRRDKDDGIALGVQGTPTFFLNGELLEVRSFVELVEQIDAALAS